MDPRGRKERKTKQHNHLNILLLLAKDSTTPTPVRMHQYWDPEEQWKREHTTRGKGQR